MPRIRPLLLGMTLIASLSCLPCASATVFSRVQGIVHDSQHRPIADAHIDLSSEDSSFHVQTTSGPDGAFVLPSVPLGSYSVTVNHEGFETIHEHIALSSNISPVYHFELPVGSVSTTVNVTTNLAVAAAETATPSSSISQAQIAETPGADRTNSMAAITDFVPGAYMTHDMLHIRGGHQVSWLIDGVEIPNTNIGSNLGAQIDPKDIDTLEVERGSYTADLGDRTYGIFNVVPRTGFDRNRQAELVLSAGSYLQTNDQFNIGDHSQRLAWYLSATGNRSDYGLSTPIPQVDHDAANGSGGFGSIIANPTPRDQLRLIAQLRRDFFQIPYDPNPNDFENQQYDSSGLRDTQNELDGLTAFTWLRTLSSSAALQVSPFFHYNRARYLPGQSDTPVGTSSDRASNYAGAQITTNFQLPRNALELGLYSFGQHDSDLYGAAFATDPSSNFSISSNVSGGVVEEYASDTLTVAPILHLIGGVRLSQFRSTLSENYVAPRIGATLRIPRLNWVFRGFYGRYYQPPPLLTASGPLLQYAQSNNTAFAPLHGERDEEHQFGVLIPYRSWTLDIDTFRNRVNNFLDHSNIGESSLYFPVSIDGALIRAWELTLRSPHIGRLGQAHLTYSNQIAEQRGNITGGLICTPAGSPECDQGFAYTPVDHDQRNTLNAGLTLTLPLAVTATTDLSYGSGFVNGSPDPATPYPNPYLPEHTTFDLALARNFGENLTASVSATNLANRRVLLDNSLTFGGFHWNDPREVFAELRYRFRF